MPERSQDWLRQAEADLRHARNSRDLHDYDWACFASHQAAEKAIKAVYQHLHMEAWGHVLTDLFKGSSGSCLINR
jgi:HEPN domain-containing protein